MEPTLKEDFQLFSVAETNGKKHTLLQAPRSLPQYLDPENAFLTKDVLNIMMADTSGSMSSYWEDVIDGWQMSIADRLIGHTKIFTFGHEIHSWDEDVKLEKHQFTSGGTNLTLALRTLRCEVDDCRETNVRVFIITDGHHNQPGPSPETEICKMKAPPGKTVNVYLLGIGRGFPVNYSIDIRSHMHNGSANMPSLFWAEDGLEIKVQMKCIGYQLNSEMVTLKVNKPGYVLPGMDKTPFIHLGEWLYFSESPEDLQMIIIQVDDQPPNTLSLEIQELPMELLLQQVFRQWNSVLIQQHRKKEDCPKDIFDLMDTLFQNTIDKASVDGNNLKARFHNKRLKGYKVEYATLLNQSKKIIGIKGKYQNEIELAKDILMSTVTARYDIKNLKLKGHGLLDYEADVEAFSRMYAEAKHRILELPQPTPEECCRITMSSTLQDMQDPDFHLILKENKFDMLKSFTMTGIPVYAPVHDASQINPWTLGIKYILVTPYTILSQRAIEAYADTGDALGFDNKDVLLKKDDEKTRFNAIIPIVPVNAVQVLKPLVRSNLYAMLATFCILKNPHIIDYNAHIAALGCAWVRSVSEFPLKSRPEFIRDRLAAIVATANIYMSRPGIVRYVNALIDHPKQALMTESVDKFDDHTVKCESLIKPLFFLHLKKSKLEATHMENLLKLILLEFIGRCLTSYGTRQDEESTIFTDFFAEELNDPKKKKNWLENYLQEMFCKFQSGHGNLVEKFFTLDELQAAIKKYVHTQMAELFDNEAETVTVKVNMKKVSKLRNLASCGGVTWKTLRSWAEEMDIPNASIEEAFGASQVMVYVSEALQHRNSRDRLAKDLDSPEHVLKHVKNKLMKENARNVKRAVKEKIEEFAVQQWREAYLTIHKPLVMPLSCEQIVEGAQAKGIEVTEDTFSKVYRYNACLRLLRNACQSPGCPYYLVPRRDFNQHLSVEREHKGFPHSLHLISQQFKCESTEVVMREMMMGIHAGRQERPVPPPPEPLNLDPLEKEIKNLLQNYMLNEE